MTKVKRCCYYCCLAGVFCASAAAQDAGSFRVPSDVDSAKSGGGRLVGAHVMPLPNGEVMRNLEIVSGRVVVVALFTGFSGSSGDNIGMQEILEQLQA